MTRSWRARFRNYSIIFAAATVLSILYAGDNLFTHGGSASFAWKRFVVVLLGWYSWAALLPLIHRLVKRNPLRSGVWWKLLLLHLGIAFFLALFLFWLQVLLAGILSLNGPRDDLQIVSWKIINYFQILVALYAIEFYRQQQEQKLKTERLRARFDELQLQTLKTRLRPVFLFETLDCLSEVMKQDPDFADDLIAMLGDFLRNTLVSGSVRNLSVRQELALVHSYLKIESALRSNKLHFRSEVPADLMDAVVPGLVLQPLLEPAIHNKSVSEPAELQIHIQEHENKLRLTITEGEEPGSNDELKNSAWLIRIRQHLAELYGDRFSFEAAISRGRGFRAEIEIPLVYLEEQPEIAVSDRQLPEQPDLRDADLESYTQLMEKQQEAPLPQPGFLQRIAKQYAISFGILTVLNVYFVVRVDLSAARMHETFSWHDLGFVVYGWYIWALLAPPAIALIQRIPLKSPRVISRTLFHISAAVFCWFVLSLILALPMPLFYKGRTYGSLLVENMRNYGFAIDVIVYWTLVAIAHALDYHQKKKEEELRADALELEVVRAQLQALHMQLHPHFLFNTLHLISELVHEDIEQAQNMLQRLKGFLKLTIENSGSQQVALDKELEFLKHYLEIQQIRFQNRLNIHFNVEKAALPVLVPNLILQPLVENAIRHGIARKSEPGLLEIDIKRNNGTLQMDIKDDGPGMNATNGNLKEGLGLSNTRTRLKRLYGSLSQFELKNPPEGGLLVSVKIPAMERQ
jgi:LytS/YehU family sensor histidine kinase